MSSGPEFTGVEQPFFDQLIGMGWRFTSGNTDHPSATGRQTFREVLILDDLKKAMRRLNLDPDGAEWLDEERLTQAANALQRLGAPNLLEANEKATELLLRGTVVDGVEGWEQGRGRTVHFIDWETPENNTFRVINQFRVACPAGQPKKFIDPDLVLFVNGIPLVVVECKKRAGNPEVQLEEAVDQLQRYANRRRELGIVDFNEGNEQLFHYSQFVVATCFDQARVGTFSAQAVHYLEWKDTSPQPISQVAAALGKETLSSQEMLVAGMLRPENLLDIVRHFTLFMEIDARRVKLVCRYQQFRAVHLAFQRLLSGKTRVEDGFHDRRGGIVWHTQGSGKSLSMVFLIRKMRSHTDLRRFKVVVVTDRKALQKQLATTATLTGENLTVVKTRRRGQRTISSLEVLKEELAKPGKDLVFAMIQKYRGQKATPGTGADEEDEAGLDDAEAIESPAVTEPFPTLNEDEAILVLVDEAHRSHATTLHANLLKALPNAARIGFTGTPIIMGAKKRTHEIFGEFIDRYTIKESEADGSTVPILYEGRTAKAAVDGGGDLDQVFEDMLVDRTPEELERIKKKYATKGDVMEAPALIGAKARNMLRHYVENIMPNGYKAQVVAVSRRAAVRYFEALTAAQTELVAELEALDPALLELSDEEVAALDANTAFCVRAHPLLHVVKGLEFAPVISPKHNDTIDPQGRWTARAKIDRHIERFKKPLFHSDPTKTDPLAFLIVKSMLLTGFDAPVEQVLYLDRHIKEAELLQAIARVNRTSVRGSVEKECGIVVDYYGIAQHLTDALAAYSDEDVEGVLQSLRDEIPKLRDRHLRAVEVFASRGVADISDIDACVRHLREERVRAEFHVKLKLFLSTLETVLPRPEALPYVNDAKTLAFIHAKARNHYRTGERLIGKEVGAKVRRLIDKHVIALGIDPKIPPIAITDPDFDKHVDKHPSARTKASEMEHALRFHVRKHLDEDPVHYEKLSERLQEILEDLEGRWEEMAVALKALVEEARKGREADETGLDPETQAPFYDVLKLEIVGDQTPSQAGREELSALTVELVDHIRQEIRIVGFWERPQARLGLRNWIFETLDDTNCIPFERLDPVVDRLLELAKAIHHKLAR